MVLTGTEKSGQHMHEHGHPSTRTLRTRQAPSCGTYATGPIKLVNFWRFMNKNVCFKLWYTKERYVDFESLKLQIIVFQ